MSAERATALLADVGGTNARFALLGPDGSVRDPLQLGAAEFDDLATAAERAFSIYGESVDRPSAAAIAVAGPVTGDFIELTNVGWRFSIEETRRRLGLERLVVVNDLAAVAWALPVLDAGKTEQLIEGKSGTGTGEVSAVVGVGTGLGVAAAVRDSAGIEVVLSGEGGHRDLAATTAREWAVVEGLAARYGGHVSAERALSGPGIAALWTALAEIDGAAAEEIAPEEVVRRGHAGDARCAEALALFAGWLGAFAGDLALTLGARGGVWLAGGVLPALGPAFDRDAFRGRFLAKGRFRGWLEGVPVRLVFDPYAALLGLARRLRR